MFCALYAFHLMREVIVFVLIQWYLTMDRSQSIIWPSKMVHCIKKKPVFPFQYWVPNKELWLVPIVNVFVMTWSLTDVVLDWGLNPGPLALYASTLPLIPLRYRGGREKMRVSEEKIMKCITVSLTITSIKYKWNNLIMWVGQNTWWRLNDGEKTIFSAPKHKQSLRFHIFCIYKSTKSIKDYLFSKDLPSESIRHAACYLVHQSLMCKSMKAQRTQAKHLRLVSFCVNQSVQKEKL